MNCFRTCYELFQDLLWFISGLVMNCFRMCYELYQDLLWIVSGLVINCFSTCYELFQDLSWIVLGLVMNCFRTCYEYALDAVGMMFIGTKLKVLQGNIYPSINLSLCSMCCTLFLLRKCHCNKFPFKRTLVEKLISQIFLKYQKFKTTGNMSSYIFILYCYWDINI